MVLCGRAPVDLDRVHRGGDEGEHSRVVRQAVHVRCADKVLVEADFERRFCTAVGGVRGADIPLIKQRPVSEVVKAGRLVDGEETGPIDQSDVRVEGVEFLDVERDEWHLGSRGDDRDASKTAAAVWWLRGIFRPQFEFQVVADGGDIRARRGMQPFRLMSVKFGFNWAAARSHISDICIMRRPCVG